MPTSFRHNPWLVRTVGIVVVVLTIGFVLAWFYMQHRDRLAKDIHYVSLPPVAISRDGHSMSATFVIKTSAADAEWAAANKQALQQMAQRILMELDPQQVLGEHARNGLQTLQNTLRTAGNETLQTTRVQEMLLTEFLVSEGDY